MKLIIDDVPTINRNLFGNDIELLPSVTEVFELELAYLEYLSLNKAELLNRSAFIKSIGNKYTQHYLLYANLSNALLKNRSQFTKAYFTNGQFSTGYATHGLFPYRGKFHPQLIKGLLNIINVKPGDLVLDPMCGSGTLNIEASLMGIDSIAVDISPFCQFMTLTKFHALSLKNEHLEQLVEKREALFNFFLSGNVIEKLHKIKDNDKLQLYNFALLAFLDSMGYSIRVKKYSHKDLFYKVLERYVKTINDLQNNPHYRKLDIGKLKLLPSSNAKDLRIDSNSIDAVVTSPPYSFAIDYIKNDQVQLEYLGHDIGFLRNQMVGLRGKTVNEKLEIYFSDMDEVCHEICRVLKPNKFFIMIIGSNTNQTGGIRLEENIINYCEKVGLNLVKKILKPIKGLRNTMKDEWILFFRKEDYQNENR